VRRLVVRRRGWLIGAALAYLLAAWQAPPGFYDGFSPQRPYNWVSPPPRLARGNKPPQSAIKVVSVGEAMASGVQVQTADQQASVVIPAGALQPMPGATAVTVRIDPVSTFPNPHHLVFETNVYRISANAQLVKPMSVALTFSNQVPAPSTIYEAGMGEATWRPLATQSAFVYQLNANAPSFGDVVGALPAERQSAGGGKPTGGQPLLFVVGGLILLVLLAALPFLLRPRRRSDGSGGP
jgi:hypothetical protein